MSTALNEARERVASAAADVDTWSGKAEQIREAAADLEATSGRQVLDDPAAADEIAAKIGRQRTDAEIADRAARECERRLDAARQALLKVAARQVRDRAERLRSAAADRDVEIGRLLDELEELDGRRYAPTAISRDHQGQQTVVGRTGADDLRSDAAGLDVLATEIETTATQAKTNPAILTPKRIDQLVRKADPEGPEAQARAEADRVEAERAEAARRAQAARIEADREAKPARDRWIRDRAQQIANEVQAPVDSAMSAATTEFAKAQREHGGIAAALAALTADEQLVSA